MNQIEYDKIGDTMGYNGKSLDEHQEPPKESVEETVWVFTSHVPNTDDAGIVGKYPKEKLLKALSNL
jgi:hypothetical protein